VLQVKPHDVPSHVAAPFAGTVHAVQDVPQLEMLALLAHAEPQAW
jgi:hypothetical protein